MSLMGREEDDDRIEATPFVRPRHGTHEAHMRLVRSRIEMLEKDVLVPLDVMIARVEANIEAEHRRRTDPQSYYQTVASGSFVSPVYTPNERREAAGLKEAP